jgi:hypothetical protein
MSKYVYILQDGASFYGELSRGENIEHIATAPFQVKDSDMDAAQRARRWFRSNYPQFSAIAE